MNAVSAEQAVLGAMLLDAKSFWRVSDVLSGDDFALGKHRRLFDVVSQIIRDGGEADAVTIADIHPDLADTALQLASTTPGSSNIAAYAEIVARNATQRRVVNAGQQIAKLSGDGVYSEALRLLESCMPKAGGNVRRLRDFMRDWFQNASERALASDAMTGIATSIGWLDDQTGGFQGGDLIIVAARPSVGKTALALQCALHSAGEGNAVILFSAEMAGTQVADRAISALGGVSTHALRQPKHMTDEHWSLVSTGVARGSGLPLWIDDSDRMSADDIAARVRQVNGERQVKLVLIDYLGLLRHPKAERQDIAIGETTKALKRLAKQLRIPVVLLAQLNRDGANTRPVLSMLRGSGDIEQDADVVIFLHRPDDDNMESVELILAKQRNGPTGDCWLNADMSRMRFTEGERPVKEKKKKKTRRGFNGASNADRRYS